MYLYSILLDYEKKLTPMKPISHMWLVVHVPKTAGTSFRQALERHFGVDRVIRDYGPNADATTDVVRRHLYSNDRAGRPDKLVEEICRSPAKVLVGHFSLQKYAKYFEPENIITFMREPLVRTCSEYLHRVKNETYDGSFRDFISKPTLRNVQSRILRGIPESSVMGLTEQYRSSLRYINKLYGFKLGVLKTNVHNGGGGLTFAKNLSGYELDLFHSLNEDDLMLYKSTVQRFSCLDIPKTKSTQFLDLLKRG